MLTFGFALRAHNPFLGYHGNFDEAAHSCFKTALVFGILATLSAASVVVQAVRSKMGPPLTVRGDYSPV